MRATPLRHWAQWFKNAHLQYTGQGEGLGSGGSGGGIGQDWQRVRGQLQKDSCGYRWGQSRDRAGTHIAVGLLRHRCNEVQGQGLGYMTQHLVLCVCGSLNLSLCLGRYFSR